MKRRTGPDDGTRNGAFRPPPTQHLPDNHVIEDDNVVSVEALRELCTGSAIVC